MTSIRLIRGSLVLLLGCAWILAPGLSHALGKRAPLPPRFPFTIDPKASIPELLPPAPVLPEALLPWLVQDLTQVPEVLFQKSQELQKTDGNGKDLEPHVLRREAMKQTAHTLAKINHLNKDGKDHFMRVLLKNRPDLAGLSFVMGDACRTSKGVSRSFGHEVEMVREAIFGGDEVDKKDKSDKVDPAKVVKNFWTSYENLVMHRAKNELSEVDGKTASPTAAERTSARIAVLMQMLGPNSPEMHLGLVQQFAGIDHQDATRALTRLAVFSFDEKVRSAALTALKEKAGKAPDDVILAGLRYPWPAIAKNASEAAVKLGRKDLVSKLVDLLDEPVPQAPVVKTINGKKTPVVRELVRLNHHLNCITCHAPGNGPDGKIDVFGGSAEFLTGAVPSPGQELPSPSQGYSRSSPDIVVRVDVTYLRQDFSHMQKVEKAAPWPDMQRFDFLVRTRAVTAKEVEAYREWLAKQGPDYLAPNHQAALAALRSLTGRDLGPNAEAWRKALAAAR